MANKLKPGQVATSIRMIKKTLSAAKRNQTALEREGFRHEARQFDSIIAKLESMKY